MGGNLGCCRRPSHATALRYKSVDDVAAAAVCSEARNGRRTLNPEFVGPGKGTYKQESKLTFVGDGVGDFAMTQPEQSKPNFTLLVCLVGCVAALVGVGLWFLGHTGTITTSTTSLAYNCSEAASTWTASQKQWCCKRTQYEWCTDASLPYDCKAGAENWALGWSTAKQDWCCRHGGRGCSTAASPTSTSETTAQESDRFDCESGFFNWQHEWSAERQKWCCDHHQRACKGAESNGGPKKHVPHWVHKATTHSQEHVATGNFDCFAGFGNWQQGWSISKKAWCCQHEKRGCPPQMLSVPYDCHAGYAAWMAWSDKKKSWCCHKEHRGCVSPNSAAYDCAAGYNNWQKGWSVKKIAWCCKMVDCPGYAAQAKVV